MINKLTEHCVSYDTALLLKEIGFDVVCEQYYGPYAHHNGEPIDADDEFELKDEGKENEIEYKIIKLNFVHQNKEFRPDGWCPNEKCCSCPTIDTVVEWILVNYNTHLKVEPFVDYTDKISWVCYIQKIDDIKTEIKWVSARHPYKHQALEEAIKHFLLNH